MKSKIFMYLFFFAALFIVFQYMNEKTIYEAQEKSIANLTEKTKKQKDSIVMLHEKIRDLDYFTLQGNDNAMTYLERLGMDAKQVEDMISEEIMEKNLVKGGNPLIPLEGMTGEMRVNKLKFMNHRWIQADFSDGSYWGEMVIEYFFDENNNLELKPIGSVLYPN